MPFEHLKLFCAYSYETFMPLLNFKDNIEIQNSVAAK